METQTKLLAGHEVPLQLPLLITDLVELKVEFVDLSFKLQFPGRVDKVTTRDSKSLYASKTYVVESFFVLLWTPEDVVIDDVSSVPVSRILQAL